MNGNDFEHTHDIAALEAMQPQEDDPIWNSERILLRSAGIDIGSTTSHLMFSEIVLRRQGISLSSRFQIVRKKVIYESPILITPFLDGNVIDTNKLTAFFDKAYAESGIKPEEIETGAVIVTGEAARKDNAEAIAMLFSAQAGKFVCASAGHHLEAKMAAYGSGAVEVSAVHTDSDQHIMNIDMGGGTTKFGIARNGAVVDSAAINVGARLFVFDENDRIIRIEAPGQQILDHLKLNLKLGDRMTHEVKHQVCHVLAGCVVEIIKRGPPSKLTQQLTVTPPLSFVGPVRHLMFSGGVSEYIFNHESRDFGDLGRILAEEIRETCFAKGFPHPVQRGAERIRATVIGASQYTVQVSGSTIFLSNLGVLPLRNLQTVAPLPEDLSGSAEDINAAILKAFRLLDAKPGDTPVALAIRWRMGPGYDGLKNLCLGILKAMAPSIARGFPLVLVFDADVGRLVGHILKHECAATGEVLSIDGIELQDFDFVDIGELMPDAQVVPVVIKSLVFRS